MQSAPSGGLGPLGWGGGGRGAPRLRRCGFQKLGISEAGPSALLHKQTPRIRRCDRDLPGVAPPGLPELPAALAARSSQLAAGESQRGAFVSSKGPTSLRSLPRPPPASASARLRLRAARGKRKFCLLFGTSFSFVAGGGFGF
jgi:hypothetical protein